MDGLSIRYSRVIAVVDGMKLKHANHVELQVFVETKIVTFSRRLNANKCTSHAALGR
jgi:hypothetical protein